MTHDNQTNPAPRSEFPLHKTATGKVLDALLHVRAAFPEVSQVEFAGEARWLYSDDSGIDGPSFEGAGIDVGILEDAADEADANTVYTLPKEAP